MLTTENAGAADCVEHGKNGFVIPPADETALAECLSWCASHPQDLWHMRSHALSRASVWTWAHFRRAFAASVQGAVDEQAPADVLALA